MTEPGDLPAPPSAPQPAYGASSPPQYGEGSGPCPSCGGPFGPDVVCQACGQLSGVPVGVRLSSLGKRFGEYLLEAVLVVVTLVIGWVIWSLIVWKDGQTPAKQVLGMRIVYLADRRPATWGRTALREFVTKGLVGAVLSAFFYIPWLVGVLLIFGGVRRQPFWDRMSNTVVVDDPH